MAVQCTNCGHPIPSGQFRCGKCGHVAARESLEDFSGLTELGDLDAPFELPLARPPAGLETLLVRHDDDQLGRESIVPKGTFASEVPASEPPAELRGKVEPEFRAKLEPEARPRTEPEARPRTEPEARPRTEPESSVRQEASGSVKTQPVPLPRPPASDSSQALKVPERPPYLASEILREDLYPRTPGEYLQRAWLRIACVYGLLAAAFGCTLSPAAAGSLVGVVALVALDRLIPDYVRRAGWLASVGGGCLVTIAGLRVALGGSGLDALLALAVWLLPTALLLRTWHRASRTARAGLSMGIVLCAAWATATSNPGLLALGFEWHSWLPAVCWYAFCVLCLLSLLAFMGDETTGGADVWAGGMLAWFAVFASTRSALHVLDGHVQNLEQALAIAEPTFTAACAVGCAQVAAHRLGRRRQNPSVRPAALIEPPVIETA